MAKNILRGQEANPAEILALVKRLKKERAFDYARKLLALARTENIHDADLRLKLAQEHALCTYKDPDLPVGERLDEALETLSSVENLATTINQETLGIAGAIYKRKWEFDSQKSHLETSLAYYHRGYEQGVAGDNGYTGINNAFVLDLLANLEDAEAKKANSISPTAKARLQEASQIRNDLVTLLPRLAEQPDNAELNTTWWFLVTVAEAFFGLGRYEAAIPWLLKAAALPDTPTWEFETTARQLATLARLHTDSSGMADIEKSGAWKALSQFLKNNEAGVRSAFLGKVGLALSGGGFRASLFHIGVLARLAELDMLRHVEVLSCVSGGSIVGAHYYLEVRKLLQKKADADISRDDYIDIVQRLQKDFLAGVQTNIRTRVIASIPANLKMAVDHYYSRTERVGELYESEIFSRVEDGENGQPRWLNNLFINPKGESPDFKPKYDNWRRHSKVPQLILNATSLNTGHVWQFTASWMGEPPGNINTAIDGNERLRRMYYYEAPPAHRRIRLGHAVAASACVPGLFEPLTLANLYPNRVVRLVDGGVHDNQGTASLIEENCTVMLVSDASGQMSSQEDPSSGLLGVPLRTNSILQARVREAQYGELEAREDAFLLRGLMFIHLKKDLEVEPVDWIGEDSSRSIRQAPLTSYGILKDIQKRLAGIRTDLDSFSDVEAFALMTSGYRMTEHEFDRTIRGFPLPGEDVRNWNFLVLETPMKQKQGSEAANTELARLLEIGAKNAFKIFFIVSWLRALALVFGICGFIPIAWWSFTHRSDSLVRVGTIAFSIITALAAMVFGKTLGRVIRYREYLQRIALGIVLSFFGWLIAGIHLIIFDSWFLRRGKVTSLDKGFGSSVHPKTAQQAVLNK